MSTLEGSINGMIQLSGGGGGTSDYSDLTNKPSINNVTLVEGLTTEDLNISYNDLTDLPTIPTVDYPVKDVKVDGMSVVDSDDIAQIDLTGKQDTLTAGAGISILNNVISATTSLQVVEMSYDDYIQITPDNNIIYFVYGAPVLDSDYNYYTNTDNTIIVRVYHEGEADQKILWFFKGFTKSASDWTIPESLQSYTPTSGDHINAGYTSEDSTTQLGWIGWSVGSLGRNVIRSWTTDLYNLQSGTYYAVIDIDGASQTLTPYSDPYVYIAGENKIYYKGREY